MARTVYRQKWFRAIVLRVSNDMVNVHHQPSNYMSRMVYYSAFKSMGCGPNIGHDGFILGAVPERSFNVRHTVLIYKMCPYFGGQLIFTIYKICPYCWHAFLFSHILNAHHRSQLPYGRYEQGLEQMVMGPWLRWVKVWASVSSSLWSRRGWNFLVRLDERKRLTSESHWQTCLSSVIVGSRKTGSQIEKKEYKVPISSQSYKNSCVPSTHNAVEGVVL